ncbi:MAG: hypothetical protein KBA66_24680 [Leptospiraceae bacterium]|nr:hypothetical protein [Leptospiraceae bacterium]
MEQTKNSLISNKYFLLSKDYYEKTRAFLVSEEGLRDIAMLPLFFTWVPILISKSENPLIKKSCLYSMLFSSYFFLFLFASMIASMLPFVGSVLANLLHFVGTTTYLGLCCFFIYSYHRNKTLDMAVIDKHYEYLVTNLF